MLMLCRGMHYLCENKIYAKTNGTKKPSRDWEQGSSFFVRSASGSGERNSYAGKITSS
jgi:hypothetical protein